jgi:hypothetical protein
MARMLYDILKVCVALGAIVIVVGGVGWFLGNN